MLVRASKTTLAETSERHGGERAAAELRPYCFEDHTPFCWQALTQDLKYSLIANYT